MRTTFTPEIRACAECGDDFTARARDVVRCSDECGLAALRAAAYRRNADRLRPWRFTPKPREAAA